MAVTGVHTIVDAAAPVDELFSSTGGAFAAPFGCEGHGATVVAVVAPPAEGT